MTKPRIADLFCGAGGAAMGLHRAGFEVVGFDIANQPRYPFEFHQQDALTVDLSGFDAVWASPPCQGYSIMHNLPWLKGREYPLLILPVQEMLEASGLPYIIENVMGARHGAKGLTKRGLEAHGLKAGYLCGTMFGLPFYRHRLMATNWMWLAPGHPKHTLNLHPRAERYVYGGTVKGLPGGAAGLDVKPREYNPVNTAWRATHDGTIRPKDSKTTLYGFEAYRQSGNPQAALMAKTSGWKLAAEAMGIDWMKRDELTQAIPPAYSEYLGPELLKVLEVKP